MRPGPPDPAPAVSRTRDVLGLTAFVFLCFGISALGGRAAAAALPGWYAALRKPSWTPPGWVFGPVWTVLYPLVAVAGWLAWREGRARLGPLVYLLQLALNAAWPWLFFGLHRVDLALACAVALWVAVLVTVAAFWRGSRTAAVMLLPYLAWVAFAMALTHAVWRLNAPSS